MKKRTKIQQIKLFIKISIVVAVLGIFIVLGFVIKTTPTFENASIKKWNILSDAQKIDTIERIIKEETDTELLIKCVDKIGTLADAEEMQIRDATSLCYNGIKLNSDSKYEQ